MFASLLIPAAGRSQNTAGSIKASIVDSNGSAIAGANAVLTNQATKLDFKTVSNASGLLDFPSIVAGDYALTVEATGFDKYVRTTIHLTSGETRDLGTVALTIGAVSQSVSVADTVTPLQDASGERSGTVSGQQLNALALKGRDFFALAGLLPGVVDTNVTGRDATSQIHFRASSSTADATNRKLHRGRSIGTRHRGRKHGALRAQYGIYCRGEDSVGQL